MAMSTLSSWDDASTDPSSPATPDNLDAAWTASPQSSATSAPSGGNAPAVTAANDLGISPQGAQATASSTGGWSDATEPDYTQHVAAATDPTDPQAAAIASDTLARTVAADLTAAGHEVSWDGPQLIVDGRPYDVAGPHTVSAKGQKIDPDNPDAVTTHPNTPQAAVVPPATPPPPDTSNPWASLSNGYVPTFGNTPIGFDNTKWADPSHQTPKYVAGRILAAGGTIQQAAQAIGGTALDADHIQLSDGSIADAIYDSGPGGLNRPQWNLTAGPGGAPLPASTTGGTTTASGAPPETVRAAYEPPAGQVNGLTPPPTLTPPTTTPGNYTPPMPGDYLSDIWNGADPNAPPPSVGYDYTPPTEDFTPTSTPYVAPTDPAVGPTGSTYTAPDAAVEMTAPGYTAPDAPVGSTGPGYTAPDAAIDLTSKAYTAPTAQQDINVPWDYESLLKEGTAGTPVTQNTTDLINKILEHPETYDAETVARMKAAADEETAQAALSGDAESKRLGFQTGVQDSPWLASERAANLRGADQTQILARRAIDQKAAETNQADRRDAATLGAQYEGQLSREHQAAVDTAVTGSLQKANAALTASRDFESQKSEAAKSGQNADQLRLQASAQLEQEKTDAAKIGISVDQLRLAAQAQSEQQKQEASKIGQSADQLRLSASQQLEQEKIDAAKIGISVDQLRLAARAQTEQEKIAAAQSGQTADSLKLQAKTLNENLKIEAAKLGISKEQLAQTWVLQMTGFRIDAAKIKQQGDQFTADLILRIQTLKQNDDQFGARLGFDYDKLNSDNANNYWDSVTA